jgi:hypothetical protein
MRRVGLAVAALALGLILAAWLLLICAPISTAEAAQEGIDASTPEGTVLSVCWAQGRSDTMESVSRLVAPAAGLSPELYATRPLHCAVTGVRPTDRAGQPTEQPEVFGAIRPDDVEVVLDEWGPFFGPAARTFRVLLLRRLGSEWRVIGQAGPALGGESGEDEEGGFSNPLRPGRSTPGEAVHSYCAGRAISGGHAEVVRRLAPGAEPRECVSLPKGGLYAITAVHPGDTPKPQGNAPAGSVRLTLEAWPAQGDPTAATTQQEFVLSRDGDGWRIEEIGKVRPANFPQGLQVRP